MDVTLVGTGPAADAVAATLEAADAAVERGAVDAIPAADLGVVVGAAGDDRFDRAADAVGATPWLAVELGGVGGRSVEGVAGAAAGFPPAGPCYTCLRTRVTANHETPAAPQTDGEPPGEAPAVDPGDARIVGAIAGREAAAVVATGDSWLLGGVVEWPHARRQLLPVPGCEACGTGRDRELNLAHHERELGAALDAAERALDDRLGIVHETGEVESFPVPYYLARIADTTGFSDAAAANQAAGVAVDWNAAFMKALGEALERYCAGVYRGPFRRAPPGAVEDAVDPTAFAAVDGTDDPIPWVPGRALSGDTADEGGSDGAWLPAEFVHFPPPERRFDRVITTGLGLGNSPVEAVLSGLYEVLERDATMLSWYSTFEPLELTVDDAGFNALARRARSEDLTVTPLLVTQDVDVPVVTVAVHRDGEWPKFAVGSDAALDPAAAARAALAEALQNWTELRSMGQARAADEDGAIGKYAAFPRAARAFVDAPSAVPADSVGPDTVPTGRAELDALVDRVRDAGLAPYATRLTTPDVGSLGFEAVRAVVPGAQPLLTDAMRFGERAREVPETLGFEPRLDRAFHPYP